MDNHSFAKKFARYSSLGVLGTLGVSCYILADTFFIAQGLKTNGLASLNIALPVFNLMHGCGLMFGMGGATRFSIHKSCNDTKQTNTIFTNTVYIAFIVGLLFSITGIFFSRPLASLLGANAEILDMTDTYLKVLLIFAPAFIFNDTFLCFVRNDNNPVLASAAMIIGSFANILLDYIFIFPLNMGIFGAILATGLSPIISISIMSVHLIKKLNTFHLIKTKFSLKIIAQNISLGFPSLIAQLASGVAMIVFNMLILGLEGNVGVAAYGVIANISLVVIAIYNGIAQGLQPLVSEFFGQRNMKYVKLATKYSMITMVVVSLIIYIIIFVCANPITDIFNSEHNMRLNVIAVEGLKIYFSAVLFAGFNTIIATVFTSTQRALPAQILSLLRGMILIIPVAFLMSYLLKMLGIWLTYPITEGIVAVIGFLIYIKKSDTDVSL